MSDGCCLLHGVFAASDTTAFVAVRMLDAAADLRMTLRHAAVGGLTAVLFCSDYIVMLARPFCLQIDAYGILCACVYVAKCVYVTDCACTCM